MSHVHPILASPWRHLVALFYFGFISMRMVWGPSVGWEKILNCISNPKGMVLPQFLEGLKKRNSVSLQGQVLVSNYCS